MAEHERIVRHTVLVIVQILGHDLRCMQQFRIWCWRSGKYVNSKDINVFGEAGPGKDGQLVGNVRNFYICGNFYLSSN